MKRFLKGQLDNDTKLAVPPKSDKSKKFNKK